MWRRAKRPPHVRPRVHFTLFARPPRFQPRATCRRLYSQRTQAAALRNTNMTQRLSMPILVGLHFVSASLLDQKKKNHYARGQPTGQRTTTTSQRWQLGSKVRLFYPPCQVRLFGCLIGLIFHLHAIQKPNVWPLTPWLKIIPEDLETLALFLNWVISRDRRIELCVSLVNYSFTQLLCQCQHLCTKNRIR